eukprot:2485247-Rhodomonas_salina.5
MPCARTVLRIPYATSGTDVRHVCTRWSGGVQAEAEKIKHRYFVEGRAKVSSYACGTQFTVLVWPMWYAAWYKVYITDLAGVVLQGPMEADSVPPMRIADVYGELRYLPTRTVRADRY